MIVKDIWFTLHTKWPDTHENTGRKRDEKGEREGSSRVSRHIVHFQWLYEYMIISKNYLPISFNISEIVVS